jgi:hypothetical protein
MSIRAISPARAGLHLTEASHNREALSLGGRADLEAGTASTSETVPLFQGHGPVGAEVGWSRRVTGTAGCR